MIDKKDLLKELEKEFEDSKKRLGFKVSFEEIDSVFMLKDSILSEGFVSTNFSRQLCSRIIDFFRDWHGYLNNLLMPNGSYYASQTEAKLFQSEEDKENIWKLIKISMRFSSMHSLIGLTKDDQMEGKFVDMAYGVWVNEFNPGLEKILKRVYDGWRKE